MKPCVIYVDGGRAGADERLQLTCEHWDWPWFKLSGPFKGWGHRVTAAVAKSTEFCNAGYTHLVVIDPYDVVAVGPATEFEAALAAYDFPRVLLAAEGACWPDPSLVPRFGERTSNWWFPHSQVVIDLRQPPPAVLADLKDADDDQRFWTQVYLDGTPGVAIDRACRVVQSAAHSRPFDHFFSIDGDRLVNRETGSKPLFIHGNGQTDLSWFQPIIRG